MGKRERKQRESSRSTSGQPFGQWWQQAMSSLTPDARRGIGVVFLFALALISLLSVVGLITGTAGVWISKALGVLFGGTKIFFPFITGIIAYVILRDDKYKFSWLQILGTLLWIISFNGFWHLSYTPELAWQAVLEGKGGGILGFFLGSSLQTMLGFWGALIVLLALFASACVILFNNSLLYVLHQGGKFSGISALITRLTGKTFTASNEDSEEVEEAPVMEEIPQFSRKEVEETPEEEEQKNTGEVKAENMEVLQPKKRASKVRLSLDLLTSKRYQPTSGDIKSGKATIQKTFETFGITVEMGDVNVGPTVTQYTLKPPEGVKLNAITSLSDNLALALAAHPIRIEAPIPGKSLVGIEVPNQKTAIVTLREILESDAFKKRKNNLSIALGKDVSGTPAIPSLLSMPHVLIAGATGSGKSVCINVIINSLLYQNTPEELRLIMVDPKRVELRCYNDIPHLLTPVVTDVKKTINALKWAVSEMERRFEVLAQNGKRDLTSYNLTASEKLPYIVVIIDELADIMVTSGPEAENLIIRLAQMARAVGIHLILATQRPSVDVITGLIKANIPTRIAFSVASQMDSRTILDMPGADKLVGKGDMLYLSSDLSKPVRIQGVYMSDDEISAVTEFLRESGEPSYEESVTEKINSATAFGDSGDDEDDMLPAAKEVVIQAGKASASLLQRRLRVGYARAARLLDLLEAQGIIGPGDGARPREILISSPEELDMMSTSYDENEV